jgi:hypothetical protein
MLSLSSWLIRPDPPVSTTPADFPVWLVIRQVFARRSGLDCPRDLPRFRLTLRPYVPPSLRREEKWRYPNSSPPPGLSATEYCVSSSTIPTPVSVGLTLRRCNVRLMLRPAGLLALLYRSDREFPNRRGRLRPSFPEVGHPNPESGMTTQPLWGETVTGLSPAGALPLWAAHSVGYSQKGIVSRTPIWGLHF